MAFLYILYSETLDKFYIGSCMDLQKRLQAHHDKFYKSSFTSKANDWNLFYSLEKLEYTQARKIEKHIKSMHSSKYLRDLKKYPEMSKKLIERFQ